MNLLNAFANELFLLNGEKKIFFRLPAISSFAVPLSIFFPIFKIVLHNSLHSSLFKKFVLVPIFNPTNVVPNQFLMLRSLDRNFLILS